MCTERFPPPLPPGRARRNRNFCSTLSPFRQGGRRERKRRLGASETAWFAAAAKGIGSGAGVSVCAKLSPPPRKEAAQCKRLTRAQTTWHFAVGVAVPTPQRSVNPTRGERGEGEGDLACTRRRAHQSVLVKSLHRFTPLSQFIRNQQIANRKG